MEFDNENSRCVSAGPEPDARVCVILRGDYLVFSHSS